MTRQAPRRLLIIVAVCFALGFAVTASFQRADPLKRGFDRMAGAFGEAYAALYVASLPSPSGSSESLLFLKGTAEAADYLRYFELHPEIDYLSPSIYPRAVRIALEVPVDETLEALKAQPFAHFVIRNYPFLLCH